ncbi:MAG: hypothetical protein ACI88A_003334 [Paraglaciecola sp.]|jgi:Tat protein secretion system quality control protein TatD with DNase activity
MVHINVGKPMSIQDIPISNNQHKKLINAVPDDRILVEGDDGELIVNVSEYKSSKLATKGKIIELIIGDEVLDPNAQYWVFK